MAGAPDTVAQACSVQTAMQPAPGRSDTAAEWLDQESKPTGLAAVILSENCACMTHGLLLDDFMGKRRLVQAMVGALVPETWPGAAEKSN